MKRKLSLVFFVLAVLCMVSAGSDAGEYVVAFTAEDLMTQASFPTRTPYLVGNSLVFERGDNHYPFSRWEKLMELPILPAGALPASGTVTISIVINQTWVENETWDNDWDPHIMVSDGANLVGVTTLDQGGVDIARCSEFSTELPDPDPENQPVSYQGLISGDLPNLPRAQPNVPYDVRIVWTLDASMSVEASYLGVSGTDISAVGLNQAGQLSFVFVSDNQLHERYQINLVSVSVEADGPICNCSNPGFFDPPMDEDIKVKKGTRVLPLKFTLCDENGDPVTDLDISPPVAQVVYLGPSPDFTFTEENFQTVGPSDDGNEFVYLGGHWQLNLQTKRFDAKGIYEIFVESTDPNFTIFPTCSVLFEIE